MLKARGDLLKYTLANALRRAAKIVRGLRAGLTVSEREAVAEHAADEIRNSRMIPGSSPSNCLTIGP